MPSYVFGPAATALMEGELANLETATLKVMLLGSTWTLDRELRYAGQLSVHQVSDASYPMGGKTLTGVLVSRDAATKITKLDCDDVTFINLTATVRYLVFYREVQTGSPAAVSLNASPLLVVWDLVTDDVSVAAPYDVVINAGGLLQVKEV